MKEEFPNRGTARCVATLAITKRPSEGYRMQASKLLSRSVELIQECLYNYTIEKGVSI
jgi:hypothetical protein